MSQFGHLADIQTEYDTASVEIIGINELGHEDGNDGIEAVASLPWLQETTDQPVWTDWRVTYRDVIVLDHDNAVVGTLNLTDHDLEDPANQDLLRDLLAQAGAD